MRGFELIMKIFQQIALNDWLKVQKRMHYKHNYHFKKSDLVDLDISAKIMECVDVMNENNYNVIGLATNERSQLQGLINT